MMSEKVARALCRSYGGQIVRCGNRATREVGWTGDGEYMDRYVDLHWKEYVSMAYFAIGAMREPTDEMMVEAESVVPALACFKAKEQSPAYLAWQAMIDVAINDQARVVLGR